VCEENDGGNENIMRVLIDTNIFISREDNDILPDNLQELLRLLSEMKAEILIHPLSFEDLKKNQDKERQEIMLSKIRAYSFLESPPDPKKDQGYLDSVGKGIGIDDSILYAVYKDAVDFLITEDRGIHKKAKRLGVDERVFLITEAIPIFKNYKCKERIISPPALKKEFVYNLDLEDPIFDSLKEDYEKFKFGKWFKKISREGRKCWVHYKEDGGIGALLIYKFEDEPIDSAPPLPRRKRLKISTFVVTDVGHKIGELFIKLALDISVKNNLSEIHLTHFTRPEDRLVELISEYGFYKAAVNQRGEEVFIKKVEPGAEMIEGLSPVEIAKRFYPCFYDGTQVKKFIIPIKPEYHNRLFTDFLGRQTTIPEHGGDFIVEGNTIKKAYLSHSRIRKMEAGDIVLFYRSKDQSRVTSIGVIESVNTKVRDAEKIIRFVGKRTVYSWDEIEEFAKKPTTVILFLHHFHLKNPLHLDKLKEMGVLTSAPQSIIEISDEKYLQIKREGGIDERFTFD
jgi:rRNA-processing protein FCF1/predicted RNA-binding protein with PUA-like domain